MVNGGCPVPRGATWHNPRDSHAGARSGHSRAGTPQRPGEPPSGDGTLGIIHSLAPLLVFGAVVLSAALYVAYVLWPRWPDAPVALDAPSLPIVISGVTFNIEPAAIRMSVQRRPGAHERVDLSYLWPTLVPPDPAIKPTVGAPTRSERAIVRHDRVRRRHAAADGACADNLPALSGGASRSRVRPG